MTKLNKSIAHFFLAIILVSSFTTFSFAETSNIESSNNIVATESGTGFYTVGRYRTVVHRRWFRAGDMVAITLNGDGYTNLDLYVYDARGNLIDYRVSSSDYETMHLEIWRSETFRIKVVNRGSTYNDYSLRVVRY